MKTPTADDFFNLEGLCEVKFKSREKLISMRIQDFLALAEDGYDPEKAEFVESLMRSDERFTDVPCLLVDHNGDIAKITGHEGRHRARALAALGHEYMPVVLVMRPGKIGYSIRWSEQTDPERFDYAEVWPEVLEAETGSLPAPDGGMFQMPFPVSREDAAKAYVPGECPEAHELPKQNASRMPAMR